MKILKNMQSNYHHEHANSLVTTTTKTDDDDDCSLSWAWILAHQLPVEPVDGAAGGILGVNG